MGGQGWAGINLRGLQPSAATGGFHWPNRVRQLWGAGVPVARKLLLSDACAARCRPVSPPPQGIDIFDPKFNIVSPGADQVLLDTAAAFLLYVGGRAATPRALRTAPSAREERCGRWEWLLVWG